MTKPELKLSSWSITSQIPSPDMLFCVIEMAETDVTCPETMDECLHKIFQIWI